MVDYITSKYQLHYIPYHGVKKDYNTDTVSYLTVVVFSHVISQVLMTVWNWHPLNWIIMPVFSYISDYIETLFQPTWKRLVFRYSCLRKIETLWDFFGQATRKTQKCIDNEQIESSSVRLLSIQSSTVTYGLMIFWNKICSTFYSTTMVGSCWGLIHNTPLVENLRFPYLLPARQQLTRFSILDCHQR